MTATLTSSAKRILVKTQNYPLREGPASFPAYSDLTAIWAITKNPAHKAYIASVMCIEFTREMTLSKTLCWDLDQFDLIPKNPRFKLGTKIGECIKQVGIRSLCESPYACIDEYTCIGAGGIEIGGHPRGSGEIEGPSATLRWNVQVEKGQ